MNYSTSPAHLHEIRDVRTLVVQLNVLATELIGQLTSPFGDNVLPPDLQSQVINTCDHLSLSMQFLNQEWIVKKETGHA